MAERLHFLDWFRTLMIWAVVYGHLCFSGLTPSPEVIVDNHAFASANGEKRNSLGVRYMSIVRQWCIPLLFWVAGAASSLSHKDWPKTFTGIAKIALITVIGLLANGFVWAMSPMDTVCSPMDPCKNKGILFDFTVVPNAGVIFPIVFQMWFTTALIVLVLLNKPLFDALSNRGSKQMVAVQGLVTVILIAGLVKVSDQSNLAMWPLLSSIAICEALFLSASLAARSETLAFQANRQRFFHYICALAVVFQVSLIELTDYVGEVTVIYIILMCNKLYALGFIMTYSREAVGPCMSRCWPIAFVLSVLVAPSSSWSMSGHMTYPYYDAALDRCLYLGGGLVAIFSVDRVSRDIKCDPQPNWIGNGGLLLYLLHPAMATCLIATGLQTQVGIWFVATCICMALAFAFEALRRPRRTKQSVAVTKEDGLPKDEYTELSR